MITITQFKDNFKTWILGQVDKLSTTNPVLKYTKPIIKRSIDKKIHDIDKFIDYVTDANGNIDIEGIINETILNIKDPEVCTLDVPILGSLELGNGGIKMHIPMTDKQVLFKTEDLETLKETLLV